MVLFDGAMTDVTSLSWGWDWNELQR